MAAVPELNKIHFGDAYAVMSKWPDGFVDCTVTSIPYWLQRLYLPDGHPLRRFEMGQEASLEKYVSDIGDVFKQVLRVTKDTGVLWLNVGDKVAGPDTRKGAPTYKPGELLDIPGRIAEELRRRGWLRVGEVIWSKPNTIPDTAPKRPVMAHERVYLFAKTRDYFFDQYAAQEVSKHQIKGGDETLYTRLRAVWEIPVVSFNGKKLLADLCEGGRYLEVREDCPVHGIDPQVSPGALFDATCKAVDCTCPELTTDFFAAFPPRLVERCILLGTSEKGDHPETGLPYERVTNKRRISTRPGLSASEDASKKARKDPRRHVTIVETVGWKSGEHELIEGVPMRPVVLDPFSGSGTTAMVAAALGRDYLGIELNPVYATKLGPRRVEQGWTRSCPHAPRPAAEADGAAA